MISPQIRLSRAESKLDGCLLLSMTTRISVRDVFVNSDPASLRVYDFGWVNAVGIDEIDGEIAPFSN
jgi:hypothetical protein